MNIYLSIFVNFLVGIVGGVFGGLGMGGGTLLIPLLSIVLGYEQKLCQGINLVSFLVMASISLLIHYKHGFLELRGTFYIIISGLIFSSLGAVMAGLLPSKILRICFGVFLCILAFFQLFKLFKKHKD